MKKHRERLLAFFMVIVLCLTAATVTAGAEGAVISKSVRYGDNGKVFVNLLPYAAEDYITYTTDGTAPTADSPRWVEEIGFAAQTSVKASEYTPEGTRVCGKSFTVAPRCLRPEFNITYEDGQTVVEMTTATQDASVYYTLDGSVPDENSYRYTDTLILLKSTTVRAVTILEGNKNSAVISKNISVKTGKSGSSDTTSGDTSSAEGSSSSSPSSSSSSSSSATSTQKEEKYTQVGKLIRYQVLSDSDNGQTLITLIKLSANDIVYYTLDGTNPTTSSTVYDKKIYVKKNSIVKVVEYNQNGKIVGSARIPVSVRCYPVEFYCTSVTYGARTLKLVSKTPKTTIYYTIDGEIPTPETGVKYDGKGVTVGDLAQITAAAYSDEYDCSVSKDIYAIEALVDLDNENVYDSYCSEVVEYINEYRERFGLRPFSVDDTLSRMAYVRAMETFAYSGHTRPAGTKFSTVFGEYETNTPSVLDEFSATYISDPEEIVTRMATTAVGLIGATDKFKKVGVGHWKLGGKDCCVILVSG